MVTAESVGQEWNEAQKESRLHTHFVGVREGQEEVGRGVEMETERGGLRRVQPHHMRHHVTELTNQIAHLGARQIAAGNNSQINTYFDVTTIIIIMFCTDMKRYEKCKVRPITGNVFE
jgi:hypothetical protein